MRLNKFVIFSFVLLLGCNSNEQKVEELNGRIIELETENQNLKSELEGYKNQPSNDFGPMPSNNNVEGYSEYSLMDDESLIETFKNYMSDKDFRFVEFSYSKKGIRVKGSLVSNVEVRKLQKENQVLFAELLSRFNRIVFVDEIMDYTYTLSKR